MKQLERLKLVAWLEEGLNYENSCEVRALVDSSDQATSFYTSLVQSKNQLISFYQSKELKKVNKNLNKFIDKQMKSENNIRN